MKQKGFMLIERLIVIVMIGILAAITIPAYQKHKQARGNSPTPLYQPDQFTEPSVSAPHITCIDGLKFNSIDQKQVVDSKGNGIDC